MSLYIEWVLYDVGYSSMFVPIFWALDPFMLLFRRSFPSRSLFEVMTSRHILRLTVMTWNTSDLLPFLVECDLIMWGHPTLRSCDPDHQPSLPSVRNMSSPARTGQNDVRTPKHGGLDSEASVRDLWTRRSTLPNRCVTTEEPGSETDGLTDSDRTTSDRSPGACYGPGKSILWNQLRPLGCKSKWRVHTYIINLCTRTNAIQIWCVVCTYIYLQYIYIYFSVFNVLM